MLNYIITDSTITVLLEGVPIVLDNSHSNFEAVKEGIKNNMTEEQLIELVDTSKALNKYSAGRVTVENGVVYYKGTSIKNTLTSRILTMMRDGFNVDGMCKFMDNLYSNPSKTAVDELYLFLESCNLPITEDGHFLAYKKVREDYKDIYSGTFDNSIGAICEMERNEVDDNRNNTCSAGLHFASYSYMKHYGGTRNSDRIVIVKINPGDVVSIPSDYNNAKGRTWRYEVVNEVKNDGKSEIKSDCISNEETYHENYSTMRLKEDSATSSVDEEMSNVNMEVYSQGEKELKQFVSKSLYSGTLTVDMLLVTLDDIDPDVMYEVEEFIEYEEPNFNQIANFVRDCAFDLGVDLEYLLAELEYVVNVEPVQDTPTKIEVKETKYTTDMNKDALNAIDLTIEALKQGVVSWSQIKGLTDKLDADAETFNDYNNARKALIQEYNEGNLVITEDELTNI